MKGRKKVKVIPKEESYKKAQQVITTLEEISIKRTGGAQNIRGISFQLLYSCYIILEKLVNSETTFQLEGLEDIDYLSEIDDNLYIQLKTSQSVIDASDIWEMKVIQNFYEVYTRNSNATFQLVHNTSFSSGKLDILISKSFTPEKLDYWKQRFKSISIEISDEQLIFFFKRINFKRIDEDQIKNLCSKILLEMYGVNFGTERIYLNALYYNVSEWAKARAKIRAEDLKRVLQDTTDSFSKSPTNKAIENSWISKVSFDLNNKDVLDYYDGKSAKPIHIANQLPVHRLEWESVIEKSIKESDVSIIKASSGQGKSTLAWLVSNTLQLQGYSVYQLNHCREWDNVIHISDFIESRLRIGELPLIVIDGLASNHEDWGSLADKLKDLPVKFLISTREEDWYRYGIELSKLKLKIVDIKLSIKEAEEIYKKLKEKGRINAKITDWQPVWESVKEKGLLIEYVYLLTQGKMIHDRLNEQIKSLNKETGAVSKIEILRLISLADVLDIKLQTSKLSNYIQSTVKFENDRNEVYKQLEKEYYIKFDGKYVEGLHPIRSKHLVDILHSSISLLDSTTVLLGIIDIEFIFNYFRNVPFILLPEEKNDFYDRVSDIVSSKSNLEIVQAIDGLIQVDASYHLQNNKEIFDDVADKTAGIEIFIYDTTPFNKVNFLSNLQKTLNGNNPNINFLEEKSKQVKLFKKEESDTAIFLKYMQKKMHSRQSGDDFDGLTFLMKWFHFFDISFPALFNIDDKNKLQYLLANDNDKVANVFKYLNSINFELQRDFFQENKLHILSYLKRSTDSIQIEESEDGKEIHITYLLDDKSSSNTNESSVKRINTIYDFLPYYERYCTKVIFLPYPNEQMYEVVAQNAEKAMPKENISDEFNVHLNQLWASLILDNYRSDSAYSWQKQIIDIRNNGVEYAKICTRIFELHIEENTSRLKSTVEEWVEQTNLLLSLIQHKKKYPRHDNKSFKQEEFKDETKKIDSWSNSITNFANQMSGIINPKGDNDRNLATFNLKSTVFNLKSMQEAYGRIASATFDYFSHENLCVIENEVYTRLLKTVLFYLTRIENSDKTKIYHSKETVANWYDNNEKENFNKLIGILNAYEYSSDFVFHKPNRIIEDEYSKSIVIGVEGIDLVFPDKDIQDMLIGISDFSKTRLEVFTFVNIFDGKAVSAFRVHRNYFERIGNWLEQGGEFESASYGNPYLVNIDEEILSCLDNISIMKINVNTGYDQIVSIMYSAWKLNEYRSKLNNDISIEKEWLIQIENELTSKIHKELADIKKIVIDSEYKYYEEILLDFIKNGKQIPPDEIVEYLHSKLQAVLNQYILNRTN